MTLTSERLSQIEHRARAFAYIVSLMMPRAARTGQDETKSVTVVLDETGRTVDLQLALGWTNRIKHTNLAAAIDSAARSARLANLDDLMVAIERLPDDLSDVRVPKSFRVLDPGQESVDSDTVDASSVPDLLETMAGLHDQAQRLNASPASEPDQFAAPEPTAEHPVTFLTDSQGGLLRTGIDKQWLAGMVNDDIGPAIWDHLQRHLEGAQR